MTLRRVLAVGFVLGVLGMLGMGASPAVAVEPVRMGCGIMTFDTVPGWGLDAQGASQIGPTHGSVVVDSQGLVYTSSNLGIFVFSPDGTLVRRHLGDDYTSLHDMEIRSEDGRDFIYGARNAAGEGIKFDAETGGVVLRLGIPSKEACGLEIAKWAPTAITVAPNGEIYLSDGYASNHIFRFSPDGTYLSHFGTKGNGMKEFNTAHGMTLDTRYDPPRLLICDRNHEPKGRLLHYDLDGNFLEEVITGLGMPTSAAVQGDYVSVPDLHGGAWAQPRPGTWWKFQRATGRVDRGNLQRHPRLLLGCRRQSLRPGLERLWPHHEVGPRRQRQLRRESLTTTRFSGRSVRGRHRQSGGRPRSGWRASPPGSGLRCRVQPR
jgi:hypothetical protein